jgi:hypothetical protein
MYVFEIPHTSTNIYSKATSVGVEGALSKSLILTSTSTANKYVIQFISVDQKQTTNRGNQGSVKQRKKDMWTEITKDLVIREAIDSMGYSCEETDDFFYVMEYLRYVS